MNFLYYAYIKFIYSNLFIKIHICNRFLFFRPYYRTIRLNLFKIFEIFQLTERKFSIKKLKFNDSIFRNTINEYIDYISIFICIFENLLDNFSLYKI